MDVSIFAAFLAGLVSFLSPCVLPLVPGYISMLSGIGVEQLKEGKTPRAGLLASALAFVTGFSVVFISFGASASARGRRVDRPVRPAPHRPARENFRARRIAHRLRTRHRRTCADAAATPPRRVAETHPLHRHRLDFPAGSVTHA